jgi:hypothetical protein
MSNIWLSYSSSQEVGGTLIGENGLVLMAGAVQVEWYQIHQSHGFKVFDAIPFAPFQALLCAVLPSQPPLQFI